MEVEVFKWSSFLHFGPFSSMYYFVCCHDHKSCHFLKCCIIDAKICCLWFQSCFLLIDTLLNRSSIYFYLILFKFHSLELTLLCLHHLLFLLGSPKPFGRNTRKRCYWYIVDASLLQGDQDHDCVEKSQLFLISCC